VCSSDLLGNKIEMYPVTSSNVLEVGYKESNEIVFVRFTNNSVYAYKGVNQYEFENLKTALSVGSYLARNFKIILPLTIIFFTHTKRYRAKKVLDLQNSVTFVAFK
jgi:hypothetical protein